MYLLLDAHKSGSLFVVGTAPLLALLTPATPAKPEGEALATNDRQIGYEAEKAKLL
jgi:hypothetical protein